MGATVRLHDDTDFAELAQVRHAMTGYPLHKAAKRLIDEWHADKRRIVFTNGVFDLLHRGHVEYLEDARKLGDVLVVGLNGDASVSRLKGPKRPLLPQAERAALLEVLESVNLVIIFDEDTPEQLIREVQPQVLVKGADWAVDDIVGKEIVESMGGKVQQIPVREGLSTTKIIERILAGESGEGR